MVIGTLMEQR
jgi:hypothetical protein